MCILPRLKIIHFNPSRTLLKELMFTFMMNLSSNSSKENGKRKEKGYHCSYCEKSCLLIILSKVWYLSLCVRKTFFISQRAKSSINSAKASQSTASEKTCYSVRKYSLNMGFYLICSPLLTNWVRRSRNVQLRWMTIG